MEASISVLRASKLFPEQTLQLIAACYGVRYSLHNLL
jgi:hypothetical protein